MKIIFLTTDDPLYLPAFFDRVLDREAGDTLAVYVAPPLYKRQTAALHTLAEKLPEDIARVVDSHTGAALRRVRHVR
jgi:hypothetical protein